MKTKTTYVKLLHSFSLCLLLMITAPAISQTAYEGFGALAVGGSNSTTVYHVTNTNSSGAGSLANGIGSNRTIVFDVSGTIVGRFDLIGISYLTIDATGRDITINNNVSGDAISFDGPNTHHCILKGLHVTNAGGDGINVIDGNALPGSINRQVSNINKIKSCHNCARYIKHDRPVAADTIE